MRETVVLAADWPRCQRIVGGVGEQCGLLASHGGVCVPFTPGWYLPAPMLHPLAELLVRARTRAGLERVCPNGCSRLVAARSQFGWSVRDAFYLTTELAPPTYLFDWDRFVEPQVDIRFDPCGCEFRQILNTAAGAASRGGHGG